MAGLVVIDFIDMEYSSNVRKVEKAMKDALRNDRARIQIGRISSFGLMEMSRQRLRTGVLEATTRPCPHCDGTGLVRTASSAGLSALRVIEDEAAKGKGTLIRLAASTEAAIYLLNEKRADLVEIEQRYGVSVEVVPEGEEEGAKMSVSSSGPRPAQAPRFDPIVYEEEDEDLPEEEEAFEEEVEEERKPRARRERREPAEGEDDAGRKKKRRRRRGGRGRNRPEGENGDEVDNGDNGGDDDSDSEAEATDENRAETFDENGEARPKKRRRRGGRGRKRRDANGDVIEGDAQDEGDTGEDNAEAADAPAAEAEVIEAEALVAEEAPAAEEKPKRKRAPRKTKAMLAAEAEAAADAAADAGTDGVEEAPAEPVAEASEEAPAPEEKPKRKRAPRKAKAADPSPAEVAEVSQPAPEAPSDDAGAKPRKGWWSRTFGE
jgi:ribonuclease E